jgi:hypothetical protein
MYSAKLSKRQAERFLLKRVLLKNGRANDGSGIASREVQSPYLPCSTAQGDKDRARIPAAYVFDTGGIGLHYRRLSQNRQSLSKIRGPRGYASLGHPTNRRFPPKRTYHGCTMTNLGSGQSDAAIYTSTSRRSCCLMQRNMTRLPVQYHCENNPYQTDCSILQTYQSSC